jgi:predicted ATPase
MNLSRCHRAVSSVSIGNTSPSEEYAVILTPDQRLRVFVSSTLRELAPERNAARRAIERLHLHPVMFEAGARPHPARSLYRSYLEQSHVFVGLYGQSYGWVAPGETVSGLEDEYLLSAGKPRLIYIRAAPSGRDTELAKMLQRITEDDTCCYAHFDTAEQLEEMLAADLAALLSERFAEPTATAAQSAQQDNPSLPVPPTAIVGRDKELASITDLLRREDVSLVTLVGPAGVGKTRLALELAARWDTSSPETVFLVHLEALVDSGLVLSSIAHVLDVAETAGSPPLADALRERLRVCPALLMLDNFEQVLAAAPQIADLLGSCPGLKVLVTSRAPLRLRAEHVVAVSPLEAPPTDADVNVDALGDFAAVRLFLRQAQSVRPEFALSAENAPLVAEICRRLEGLPLAIELAASRMRMFPPTALLARLEDRFELLRGAARDAPLRQSTLYDAVEWSYDLLDEQERRLLRRLSVFSGGITLESAEAVCAGGPGEEDILDVAAALEALLDNSLLRLPEEGAGEPRFRMFETIREFAAARLAESGEAGAVETRHARHFLGLAEEAERNSFSPVAGLWLSRLERELDNLRAAMARGLRAEASIPSGRELALRISAALWLFWWSRGYSREGRAWLDKCLEGDAPVDDLVRARAQVRVGYDLYQLGPHSGAVELLRTSLESFRRAGDEPGTALALSNLGSVVVCFGEYEEGMAMLEDALAIRRRLGDTAGITSTLDDLGIAEAAQCNYERAEARFRESLAVAQAHGNEQHSAQGQRLLGELLTNVDDLDAAEARLDEAEAIFTRHGNSVGETYVAHNRGVIALRRGELDVARALLTGAVKEFRNQGNVEYGMMALEGLAEVALRSGDAAEAARLIGALEGIRRTVGIPRQPRYQAAWQACGAQARDVLGDAVFEANRAEGDAWDLEQAVGRVTGADVGLGRGLELR